jgi:hypothetical protein
MLTSIKLLPRMEVQRRRGGGRGARDGGHSQLYADIADGLWPPLIKLGKASLQPEYEVDAMLAAIIAGASPDERRQLVKELIEQRKGVFVPATPVASTAVPASSTA